MKCRPSRSRRRGIHDGAPAQGSVAALQTLAPREESRVPVGAMISAGTVAPILVRLNRVMDRGQTKERAFEVVSRRKLHAGWPNVFGPARGQGRLRGPPTMTVPHRSMKPAQGLPENGTCVLTPRSADNGLSQPGVATLTARPERPPTSL